jgi:hypothetical protein
MTYPIENAEHTLSLNNTVKKKESVFWRGFKVTCNFFYETPAMVFGIVIAGVIAHFVIPQLAMTCYALAIASLLSKLFVKISSSVDLKFFDRVEEWAWGIKKKIPYIQTVLIIISLVVSYFIPVVGVCIAVVIGGYNGIIFEIEFCKKLQLVHKENIEDQKNHDELMAILV